jgi:hypothetical protein
MSKAKTNATKPAWMEAAEVKINELLAIADTESHKNRGVIAIIVETSPEAIKDVIRTYAGEDHPLAEAVASMVFTANPDIIYTAAASAVEARARREGRPELLKTRDHKNK